MRAESLELQTTRLSLRDVPCNGTVKHSSWIATARFAHLAMTSFPEVAS
jgi:hypothetical protein